MNSSKFAKYSSKIDNYDKHSERPYMGFAIRIARLAPALQLPLLSLQYTRYCIQVGIIGKTSSIDVWTKAQQPINLSSIFARHWHHISICFKPFHVKQQARCLESFKSTSPMIPRASFNGLMVESYLSCLFCFAMVCRSTVRHSTVCPRPLPAKSLLSLLPVPSYWISWLVIGFTTSAPPEMVCVAVEQRF